MNATTLLPVLAHAVGVFLIGWCVLAQVGGHTGLEGRGWEWPERMLFAIAGFVAFSWVLMVAHLVSGGAVFGVAGVVPVAALSVVTAACRRRPRLRPGPVPWLALAGAALVLALLYVSPAVLGGSGLRTGDPPWHLGWTEQLLAGEPVPLGPAPEYARNAYPWGFHAVLAAATRLVPGSEPLAAHEALHLVVVAAIPLAAACLARRVDLRAGWAAAGAVGLIGGWGWIAAERAKFFTSPRLARLGADLTVASPNSVYELLPPVFPRELGLALLGAAGVALTRAALTEARRARVTAGVTAGLAGLVSLPMFVAALVWTFSIVVALPAKRWAWVRGPLGGALGVVAPWAGPAAADYVRYGGFVNVTPRLGVEWPLPVALWSWGLLLPAAAAGLLLVLRRPGTPARRALLACSAGTVVLLVLALVRGRYGWELAGNATVLHQGRVWPPLHLLGAAFAGVAVVQGVAWLAARREALAAAAGAATLAVAAVSPVQASARLAEIIRAGSGGFVFGREDFGRDAFVRRAAARLSPHDVVEVEGPNIVAFLLFAFSGARLAAYDDPRAERNDLRIRYRELAAAWDERMASGGFAPTWRVVAATKLKAAIPVEEGTLGARRWALVRARD